MIAAVSNSTGGLVQTFFEKSFPEPKDEPLFELKKTPDTEESRSRSTLNTQSAEAATVIAQGNFNSVMQSMMAALVEKDRIVPGKEEGKDPYGGEDPIKTSARVVEHRMVSDEMLLMQMRMRQSSDPLLL